MKKKTKIGNRVTLGRKPSMRTVRWIHRLAVSIPVYCLLIGIPIILTVEIELLKDERILRLVLLIILLIFCCVLTRGIVIKVGMYAIKKTLSDFTPDRLINRFKECSPKVGYFGPKQDQLVLCFHGFTSSPMEFEFLADRLRKERIDFYAPLIQGFGQIRQDMLFKLFKEDWFREIIDIYDLLTPRYKRISVVGHSMGGMLACFLAQNRPIENLILSAPAIFPQKRENLYAWAIKSRMLHAVLSWTVPMFPKPLRGGRYAPADTLDEESAYRYFQYLVAPIRSMFGMLEAQAMVDLEKLNFTSLSLLYGAHDITVDNIAIERHLKRKGVPFQRFVFENTAHNIFVDNDRFRVNSTIMGILQGNQSGSNPFPNSIDSRSVHE